MNENEMIDEAVDPTIYGGGVNFGMLNPGDKFNPKDKEVLIKVSKTRYKDPRGNKYSTSLKSGVYPVDIRKETTDFSSRVHVINEHLNKKKEK